MKNKTQIGFCASAVVLAAFILWTVAVRVIDVEAVGPNLSNVGFATFNSFVHELTGVNWWLYNVTDWLGLVPFAVVFAFGIVGLTQWIKRRSIAKVDGSILILGAFYVVVLAVYALFEVVVINHRPVLIEGILEASYPSSTTMLALTVMPTALMQINSRMKYSATRDAVNVVIIAFIAFMVIGRLISGVHWASDIIGGALLSSGLVLAYSTAVNAIKK